MEYFMADNEQRESGGIQQLSGDWSRHGEPQSVRDAYDQQTGTR